MPPALIHEEEAPPPYIPSDAESQQLLGGLQRTLENERSNTYTQPAETERLRNFLLFCLAYDYRCNFDVVLSCFDRNHYVDMANALRELHATHDNTHLTVYERVTLAPYFYKFLHAPCKSLDIPVDYATMAIGRFVKYTDTFLRYKGCTFGILQTVGPHALAQKLCFDRDIIIPRIVQDQNTAANLINCPNSMARMYFESIEGVEGCVFKSSVPTDLNESQRIAFTASERGQAYEAALTSAVKAVKSSSSHAFFLHEKGQGLYRPHQGTRK